MNPFADTNNLCFWDFETRAETGYPASDGNIKEAGTYRYAQRSFVIVSTFAIGDAPVFDVSLDRGFDADWLQWSEMPYALREFHKRVEQGEAWYAAWNTGFDKAAWNNGTYDFPQLEARMCIDIMAQGAASNLPPDLMSASKAIGREGKQLDGKALIKLFCSADGATPFSEPQKWASFKSYGRRDTDELRHVYRATRPLPPEEWLDYQISERINERGVGIDLHLVERAAKVAGAAVARVNRDLNRWTNGQITAVTQAQRIAQWVYDRIEYAEGRQALVSEWNEDAEDDLKVGKLSLAKDRVEQTLAFFTDLEKRQGELAERDQLIVDVLTARQFGASTSPAKFEKMMRQHVGGSLFGQYVLNGAGQTGRYSSKGIQTHNLLRASLKEYEAAAIEMLNEVEL